jgi:hypothetical protein
MASPTLELTGAIVAALKSANVAEGRVYDQVPSGVVFPYVSIGPSDEIRADADCIDASEINIQIDVWSRAPGYPEALRIAEAVKLAIDDLAVELTNNALVMIEHQITRKLRDPDGLTSHAAVSFTAVVEQP